LSYANWDDFNAIDKDGNVVLDFVDENGNDVSTDEDRMFVDLNGYSYKDRTGRKILIKRCWYEDEHGNEVEPDTVTGEVFGHAACAFILGKAIRPGIQYPDAG